MPNSVDMPPAFVPSVSDSGSGMPSRPPLRHWSNLEEEIWAQLPPQHRACPLRTYSIQGLPASWSSHWVAVTFAPLEGELRVRRMPCPPLSDGTSLMNAGEMNSLTVSRTQRRLTQVACSPRHPKTYVIGASSVVARQLPPFPTKKATFTLLFPL